jgi:hypothetical protein
MMVPISRCPMVGMLPSAAQPAIASTTAIEVIPRWIASTVVAPLPE